MKNKRIWIIILFVVILAFVCWWFLFKAKDKTYSIKEWNGFTQTVEILIDDDTILKADKSIKRGHNSSKVTDDGQYTIFKITGLKKGYTKVVVTICNSDDTVEKQTVYEFEVLDDLSVKSLSDSEINNQD